VVCFSPLLTLESGFFSHGDPFLNFAFIVLFGPTCPDSEPGVLIPSSLLDFQPHPILSVDISFFQFAVPPSYLLKPPVELVGLWSNEVCRPMVQDESSLPLCGRSPPFCPVDGVIW